ncbi:MAG: hypothetical protein AAFN77_01285 [Planctomycetota bacterium]
MIGPIQTRLYLRRWPTICICMFAIVLCFVATANADNRSPSVGAPGFIEELVLPGTELAGKPISDKDAMVVRVVKALPHADGFRYEIRFQGLEAGSFNLAKWLVRKDGSSTEDLPEIPVEIKSLLPPGQIKPNELEQGWIPRLGGYRRVALFIAALWVLGLLGLIFLGRKRARKKQVEEKQVTLAELLKTRLTSAFHNEMSPTQYAELERMLFGFWRKRLGLESLPMAAALEKVRNHKDSGPLMMVLERWMHSPHREEEIDLASLVEPYKNMPMDDVSALITELSDQPPSGSQS